MQRHDYTLGVSQDLDNNDHAVESSNGGLPY